MAVAPLTDRACVELFHLLFVRALVVVPNHKAHVTIKGGCNLRFFFGSVRYSEDIDFDVEVVAEGTLKKNVDKLLDGAPLAAQLKTYGLGITGFTAPEQTPTTQRWKVELLSPRRAKLHTKIEFSRRAASEEAELAAIHQSIRERYALGPLLARHYGLAGAIRQKVSALAGRAESQARDVFDLALLTSQAQGALPSCDEAELTEAGKRALGLSYGEYMGQVVSYLEPTEQAHYDAPEYWDQLQLQVLDALERMKPRHVEPR